MKHFSFKNPMQVLLRENADEPEIAVFYRDWNFKVFFPKDDKKTNLDIIKYYSNGCKYLKDLNINLRLDTQLSMAYKDVINNSYSLMHEKYLVDTTITITNLGLDFRFQKHIDAMYGGYQIINIIETFDFYSKKLRALLIQLSKESNLKYPIPHYIYHTIKENQGLVNFMHSDNFIGMGNQVTIPELEYDAEQDTELFQKINF